MKELDEQRKEAVEQLKLIRYFFKQAYWLQERFPDAVLRDVEGLVKLVDIEEIKANDWSSTPGRYVGVAPEEEDEDFDFEETLRDIHIELKGLNEEAAQLAAQIQCVKIGKLFCPRGHCGHPFACGFLHAFLPVRAWRHGCDTAPP